MSTFDGKSLYNFYKTDYDYFEGTRSGPNGMRGSTTPGEMLLDQLTGGGPRSEFFAPLRAAGIPPSQYAYYANKAGIKNVNSKSDMEQIIAAYNADERFQGSPESESSDEPAVAVSEPEAQPKPDPVKEDAAEAFLDTYKRKKDFEAFNEGKEAPEDNEPEKEKEMDMLEKKLMNNKYMDNDRKSFIDDAYDFKNRYTTNFMDTFRRS